MRYPTWVKLLYYILIVLKKEDRALEWEWVRSTWKVRGRGRQREPSRGRGFSRRRVGGVYGGEDIACGNHDANDHNSVDRQEQRPRMSHFFTPFNPRHLILIPVRLFRIQGRSQTHGQLHLRLHSSEARRRRRRRRRERTQIHVLRSVRLDEGSG